MRTRITTLILAVLTALAMMAAPASAHVNMAVRDAGVQRAGFPPGFVGPDTQGPGVVAHDGIECAAAHNPNINSIPIFDCPAGD